MPVRATSRVRSTADQWRGRAQDGGSVLRKEALYCLCPCELRIEPQRRAISLLRLVFDLPETPFTPGDHAPVVPMKSADERKGHGEMMPPTMENAGWAATAYDGKESETDATG